MLPKLLLKSQVTPNPPQRIRHYGSKGSTEKTTPKEKGLLKAEIANGTMSGHHLTLNMTAPNGISRPKAKDAVKDTAIWTKARDSTPSNYGVIFTNAMDTPLIGATKILIGQEESLRCGVNYAIDLAIQPLRVTPPLSGPPLKVKDRHHPKAAKVKAITAIEAGKARISLQTITRNRPRPHYMTRHHPLTPKSSRTWFSCYRPYSTYFLP